MEIKIPYETGMNPHSGLFELFEKKGLLVKDGNRYIYTDNAGNEFKMWRKEYIQNHDGILDLIMQEFPTRKIEVPTNATTEE